MYKITEKVLSKKREPKDYIQYATVKKLLKEFNRSKETIPESSRNVHYAQQELQTWLRNFRLDQKQTKTLHTVSYVVPSKAWRKTIGDVKYDFELISPLDRSILSNAKHLKFHKAFLSPTSKLEKLKEFKVKIREKFQSARQAARQMRVHRKSRKLNNLGINISWESCGGIIHNRLKPVFGRGESPRGYISEDTGTKGAIMKFLRSKDKQIVFQEKKPQTKDNAVGVEIEFFCDLNAEDLSFRLYEQGLGKNVFLRTDGSIRAENQMYPHELNILAKEKEIKDVIKSVSKVLLSANAKVNKTCGLHVHLDMRNRDHIIAFHNLVSAQNILFAMNPFSRQSGTYCRRQDTKVFKEAAGNGNRDMRYFGINAAAHAKHNTIEIRMHSGTVQATKINNWIDLLLCIIAKKDPVKKSSSTLRSFLKQFDVDVTLGAYIAERMAKFVGEDKKDMEERGAA
jgi:Putative amidoligase enzyme